MTGYSEELEMGNKVNNDISVISFWIATITIVGLGIRVIYCFWGFPYRLHPDEPAVVESAIDMLSRNSWEADAYNRPDQFEIKCCAILFYFLSRIYYNLPVTEAFTNHNIAFYIVARLFTTVSGATMIPITCGLVREVFDNAPINIKRIQIISALFIAFSPTLVLHSSYSTPDIPLSMLVMAFSIFLIRYLKTGKSKWMLLCSIITGLAISTKYTGAIMCVFIAIMVIYRAIVEHRLTNIVRYASVCIMIVLLTVFVVAPNLFTNIGKTVHTILLEARSEHLGADGIGFWGNMWFYLKIMLQNTGILGIIPCGVCIWKLLRCPRIEYLGLFVGGAWWICVSALSLHWIRWNVPAVSYYFVLVAAGIVFMWESHKKITNMLMIFVLLNLCMLELGQTKNILCTDARLVAYDYCKENGIQKGECLSEGYSPFEMASPFTIWRNFEVHDNRLYLTNDDYSECKYLIISSNYWNRYASEPQKYREALLVYNNLESSYKLIYHLEADNLYVGNDTNGNFSIWGLRNIIDSIRYLLRNVMATGSDIYIYEMGK